MIKLKRVDVNEAKLYPLELDDLSIIENKISNIKCLRQVRKEIDDELVHQVVDELGYADGNLKIKQIRKAIKKILANKIQEL